MMPALRGFNSGSERYTTRQLLTMTTIHNNNSSTVSGLISSVRAMIDVIKAPAKDKQLWGSILTQWEASIQRLFDEAVKTKSISPMDKNRLEHQYVVAIKGKTLYP